MRVLQWLDVHPLGTSAAEIADALALDAEDVEIVRWQIDEIEENMTKQSRDISRVAS